MPGRICFLLHVLFMDSPPLLAGVEEFGREKMPRESPKGAPQNLWHCQLGKGKDSWQQGRGVFLSLQGIKLLGLSCW